jgi:hypothetical protein
MTGEKDIARVVKKLQKKTLLEDELCVQIPKIEKRTRFRKVLLKIEISDHFMRKLMAKGAASKLKEFAKLHFEGKELKRLNKNIKHVSKKIDKAAEHFEKDNKKFSKAISLVGKKIWNRSRLFNLFYKAGKTCGMTFQYEVSGRRLSRHTIDQTYAAIEECPLN